MQEEKRQKTVHVDFEQRMSLDEAVQFLDTLVAKLKTEKSFTLTHAGQTYEVTPSQQVELEVKLQEKENKHQFELELEWIEGDDGQDSGLEIS